MELHTDSYAYFHPMPLLQLERRLLKTTWNRPTLISECECSDKEKRRIVESQKGLALEIIKDVRFSSPEASVSQYLVALESTLEPQSLGKTFTFSFFSCVRVVVNQSSAKRCIVSPADGQSPFGTASMRCCRI